MYLGKPIIKHSLTSLLQEEGRPTLRDSIKSLIRIHSRWRCKGIKKEAQFRQLGVEEERWIAVKAGTDEDAEGRGGS